MIQKVHIFKSAGTAMFQDKGAWFTLQDKEESPQELSPHDVNVLTLSGDELLTFDTLKSLDELKNILRAEKSKHDALRFSLQLMDATLSEGLRLKIAGILLKKFESREIAQFVRSRLFSTIIPKGFNPREASAICKKLQLNNLAEMYDTLNTSEQHIELLTTLWSRHLKDYFKDNYDTAESAFQILTDKGVFADLILSMCIESEKQWTNAIVKGGAELDRHHLLHDVRMFAAIKNDLITNHGFSFFDDAVIPVSTKDDRNKIEKLIDEYGTSLKNQRKKKISREDYQRLDRKVSRKKKEEKFSKPKVEFDELIIKENRKFRGMKAKSSSVSEILQNLDFYIQLIQEFLIENKYNEADNLVYQLLEYQMPISSSNQICKSLTNICSRVIEIGFFEYGRKMLSYAERVNSKDPVVYNQRAEIFKAEGNIKSAKEIYSEVRKQFPDDPGALCGYGGILKVEGNLRGAKKIYKQAMKKFPKAVVAQMGYAGVLKAKGKWEEAANIYENILQKDPDDDYARHSVAMIYLFGDNNESFKKNFKQVSSPITKQDFYWKHLEIVKNIRANDLENALQIINQCADSCPFYESKMLFIRTRIYIHLRLKDVQKIKEDLKQELTAQDYIDHLIITHAHAAINEIKEAKEHLVICKKQKERKIYFDAVCLVSERYNLNGLPKKHLPLAQLEEQLFEKELEVLTIET